MTDTALHLLEDVNKKLDRLLELQGVSTPARLNAAPFEPMLVGDYAKLAKRSPDWVRDQIRAGTIAVLPGRPYRITAAEVAKLSGGSR